jgi:hypothetical protein
MWDQPTIIASVAKDFPHFVIEKYPAWGWVADNPDVRGWRVALVAHTYVVAGGEKDGGKVLTRVNWMAMVRTQDRGKSFRLEMSAAINAHPPEQDEMDILYKKFGKDEKFLVP